MKVVTDLRVSDILAINARSYFSSRARYVVSVGVAVAYVLFLINDLGIPGDARVWFIYVAGGVIFAMAFFVLFLVLGVLNAIVLARHTSGIIGPHEVQLLPEGLRDVTPLTESFTRWSGIVRVTRHGDYLAFWISPYLAHIVPCRAFADKGAFAAFERQAAGYLNGELAAPISPPAPRPIQITADPEMWKRPA